MNEIFTKLGEIGIIPVVKLEKSEDILPLSEALIKGGINVAEITFRTEAAEGAIKLLRKENPEMTVGAGTVLTIENADKAAAAGAEFIVAPGFNPRIVEHCILNHIPMAPGCSIPSEIELALELGLDVVKFFPAEQSGGLAKIKAMAAAYTTMKFIPTGGISLDNLGKYAEYKKILACGGSFMVASSLVENKEWDKITELSKNAVEIVRNARAK